MGTVMAENTRVDVLSGARSARERQPKGRGEGSSPRFLPTAVGSTPYTVSQGRGIPAKCQSQNPSRPNCHKPGGVHVPLGRHQCDDPRNQKVPGITALSFRRLYLAPLGTVEIGAGLQAVED